MPKDTLPARISAPLPPMTPLQNVLRTSDQVANHRQQIGILVERTNRAYWQKDLSEAERRLDLKWWADRLEEWPIDSIDKALTDWVLDNPNKKPNIGNIVQILKRAWGEHNAPAVKAAMKEAAPAPRILPEAERRAQVAELARLCPGLPLKVFP